jgi:Ca2+-binding RTX toxin-like protein
MKRTAMLALGVVAVALLLTGGTVLAKDIICTSGHCVGTERDDTMQGASGKDELAGRRGNDDIFGDVEGAPAGNDLLRGGPGKDLLFDGSQIVDTDTVFGGKGDDRIDVQEHDSSVDHVECGPGTDTVFADPSDQLTDCELVNLS